MSGSWSGSSNGCYPVSPTLLHMHAPFSSSWLAPCSCHCSSRRQHCHSWMLPAFQKSSVPGGEGCILPSLQQWMSWVLLWGPLTPHMADHRHKIKWPCQPRPHYQIGRAREFHAKVFSEWIGGGRSRFVSLKMSKPAMSFAVWLPFRACLVWWLTLPWKMFCPTKVFCSAILYWRELPSETDNPCGWPSHFLF